MELWDAYDKYLCKLNVSPLVRGNEIPKGSFHLVSDILVKHTDGTFLIMQRDYNKHLGGMWEATAGGSAVIGENALMCAKRELFEETGISSDLLEPLGTEVNVDRQTIYCIFLCTTNIEKECVILQKGETINYNWVAFEELLSIPKKEFATVRMQKYILIKY